MGVDQMLREGKTMEAVIDCWQMKTIYKLWILYSNQLSVRSRYCVAKGVAGIYLTGTISNNKQRNP